MLLGLLRKTGYSFSLLSQEVQLSRQSTWRMMAVTPRSAVSTVVRSPAPSYVLVQRGKDPNKGLWSLPGGKLELGETTLAGAQRELDEECLASGKLQWHDAAFCVTDSIHYTDDGVLTFHYVIAQCFAQASEEFALTAMDDAADAAWFRLGEIQELEKRGETTPGVLKVVQRAEELYQKGVFVSK
jgi:ADP-ribose pyrophosphatase YjhB (NUDIX family)